MSRRSLLGLVFLAALWGASYMFIKVALEDLSPAMIVAARTALAALVLVPLAIHRDALGGLSKAAGVIVLLAIVQVSAPFLLISAGEQEISSSLTGILVSTTPLFTAVLAVWIDHDERSTGLRALGLVAGFVGVVLLIGIDLGGSAYALLGGIAVALAGLGYALGSFIVKRSAVSLAPIGLAAATMTASAVITAPLGALSAPAAAPSLETVGAILALGLLGTGVAFAIWNTLIVSIGPARVALVTYIAPAFAVFYGVTLLGEAISAATIAGLVLIVGGSWVAAGQSPPRARRREQRRAETVPFYPGAQEPERQAA